jgi:hypothetical protein
MRQEAIRDMDLLRIQDNVTCQAVVQVRDKVDSGLRR